MGYRVEFAPSAEKALRALDKSIVVRVRAAINALGIEPRPAGAIQLKGSKALRLRIGDYRVIYSVQDERLIVLVIRLGHRRDVYGR